MDTRRIIKVAIMFVLGMIAGFFLALSLMVYIIRG
jgi:hypothetical protein